MNRIAGTVAASKCIVVMDQSLDHRIDITESINVVLPFGDNGFNDRSVSGILSLSDNNNEFAVFSADDLMGFMSRAHPR